MSDQSDAPTGVFTPNSAPPPEQRSRLVRVLVMGVVVVALLGAGTGAARFFLEGGVNGRREQEALRASVDQQDRAQAVQNRRAFEESRRKDVLDGAARLLLARLPWKTTLAQAVFARIRSHDNFGTATLSPGSPSQISETRIDLAMAIDYTGGIVGSKYRLSFTLSLDFTTPPTYSWRWPSDNNSFPITDADFAAVRLPDLDGALASIADLVRTRQTELDRMLMASAREGQDAERAAVDAASLQIVKWQNESRTAWNDAQK